MNNSPLTRILLSCGPMKTHIDPARFIQNRSSGKMGAALIETASPEKYGVTALLGPVEDTIAARFSRFSTTRYETPEQYGQALEALFPRCDLFLSVAAVLDFSIDFHPMKYDRHSLFSTNPPHILPLPIRPVPDFVERCVRLKTGNQKIIAFAAEVGTIDQCLERALRKLKSKGADAILCNPIGEDSGPDHDTNELWLILPNGHTLPLGKDSKMKLGVRIWSAIETHVLRV